MGTLVSLFILFVFVMIVINLATGGGGRNYSQRTGSSFRTGNRNNDSTVSNDTTFIPLDFDGDGRIDHTKGDSGDNSGDCGSSDGSWDSSSDSCSCDSGSSCDSGGGCDSGGSCSCD